MSGGYYADPASLAAVASRLRGASASLEGAASPPPPPEAGACTALVAAVLAQLTDSLGGVVEGLGAAGDAVAESDGVYAETDKAEADSLNSVYGPR